MGTSHDLTADGRAKPGSGVGPFCCELIRRGIPEKKIAELARERFGGKTSVHCIRGMQAIGTLHSLVCKQSVHRIRWYASKMRTGKLSA
jgi:hypothetical protein